jgi:5-carboxymethyl-2-hydroxymuconate isomerase
VAAIHGLIIAPAAASQIGSGNMAFSLAAMGGFNYISKEIEPYPDEPFGFFSMVKDDLDIIGDYDIKEKVESQALHFMFELRQFKKRSEERGHRHWFIFIMGTIKTAKCQMHLWRLATDKEKKMQYHVTRLIKDSYGENVDREYGSLVIEQMRLKSSEARKAAKELQRKLQATTDPEERKEMARQMNDLFTQASEWKEKAKHRHYQQESIERDFLSISADMEDD